MNGRPRRGIFPRRETTPRQRYDAGAGGRAAPGLVPTGNEDKTMKHGKRSAAAIFAALLLASAAAGLDGDGNCDGRVDGADYTLWADYFGRDVEDGAARGDFNGDGHVDGADYTVWADHYGETGPVCTERDELAAQINVRLDELGELLSAYMGKRVRVEARCWLGLSRQPAPVPQSSGGE